MTNTTCHDLTLTLLAGLAVGLTPLCAGAEVQADMILIPAGEFTMGSEGKALDEDAAERPVHAVSLPAFLIDKTEVTTTQYAQFLNETKRTKDDAGQAFLGLPQYLPLEHADGQWQPRAGKEQWPMTNVTWYGATAYARWAGKRLPTEAEWEKAARGTDGRKYPWGPAMDYGKLRFGQDSIGPVGTLPVGASPCGCLDMAGNAWEWTGSVFRPYPYVATNGREDPSSAERRVARGGSWTGEPHIATTTYRFRPEPTFAHGYLGFRCAKSAE
jgi:iron(II)-dependent oxidoreductase